jgi:phage-related baseplate assembly protein
MLLPVQTLASLMQQMAAAVQGSAAQLIDLSVGAVLRALLEATASVALWLQWLIVQVLSATRAATSVGPDLDTWMADFSLTRLPGGSALGTVTFSRYTIGLAATVPVGCTIMTQDGTTQFVIVADSALGAWNGSNGYTLAASLASVNVPVQAAVAGAGGNVQAMTITVLTSPIPGVDLVTNAQPTTGGSDPESDAAFRARFTLYINSRSLATPGAILFAIASIQPGLRYALLENQTLAGVAQPGNFCVIVDDGSGSPPPALLASAQGAVDTVRPIGSTYIVVGPAIVMASVALTIETTTPATFLVVAQAVQVAIAAWIASLPIGGTLAISMLDAIAHETDPSVVSVTTTLINNASQDLTAPDDAVILSGGIVVS